MRELREERTREIPLGPGFVPGDVVGIEMGTVRHRVDLREVLAVFGRDESGEPPREITLRGRPRGTSSPRRRSFGGRISRVTLSAAVPADVAPGEYRCLRLEAVTLAGSRVPFEPVTEAAWRGWRFRVQ